MTLRNAFEGLAEQPTQEELLAAVTTLLIAMLDKMPRLDAGDRQAVRIETIDVNSVITEVSRIATLGESGFGRTTTAIPMHTANSGAAHIYQQIKVTP